MFPSELLVPIGAVFVAAFMQSITGFGMAIIATPLLIITFEPKLAVVILQFISAISNFIFSMYLHKKINFTLVWHLLIGAAAGMPLGLIVYGSVSNMTLKLLVSIFILIFLIMMRFVDIKIDENRRNGAVTGFLSGLFATTTGMSGPPLVMYLAYTKQDPHTIRATCTFYFLIVNLTSLAGFHFTGQPTDVAMQHAIHLLPGLAAGLILGNLAFKHVSPALFRQLIFIMLLASCVYTIFNIAFQ